MAAFPKTVHVTICGGGSGAHVLAGLSSLVENSVVSVLQVRGTRAEEWTRAMSKNGFKVKFGGEKQLVQSPGEVKFRVLQDGRNIIQKSDVIIICVPAVAHDFYLNMISRHAKDTCLVVGMPGQAGFEYQALSIFRKSNRRCTIMSTDSLPWACRLVKYGETAEVMGTKEEMYFSLIEQVKATEDNREWYEPDMLIQTLIGQKPLLKRAENVLKCTILSVNTLHPPIMYSKWKNWDRQPLCSQPLFYQGVDEETVKYLDNVSRETVNIVSALGIILPDVDFSDVSTIQDWLIDHYGNRIENKASLMSCLKTNRAYDGILHPMVKTADEHYEPDFASRFMTEDIPYGLIILRQIADMVAVKTPYIDEITVWAQDKLGVEYIRDGKLCNIGKSHGRLPAAYGIESISDFIDFFS